MSAIQPGDGYVLKASSSGKTLDIENVWPHEHGPETGASLVIELFQPHPFRITKLTSETALGGGFFYNLYPDSGSTYIVVPGTVNGTLCSLGVTSCGTATSFVYVQTYPDPSIGIVVSSSPLYNSNSAAYVLIGTVDQYGKNQFVKSNLLRERFRLGQADADYHHSYTDIL
jgi:hypothetical protein